MTIVAAQGPRNGIATAARKFSAMTAGPADVFESAVGRPAARIYGPLPVFAVDLKAMRDDGAAALAHASRTRWRYLIEHGGQLTTIDLREDSEEGSVEMRQHGPGARRLVAAARKAERIADARVDYEVRILDLKLIGNSVLWLHCPDSPSRDRFISFSARPGELKAGALIARLRQGAARRLRSMASAGKGTGG